MRKTRQFQTDYLISWDFSEHDLPYVNIMRLEREGSQVVGRVIGTLFDRSGCVSLRQLIEDFEWQEREESEKARRTANFAEILEKFKAEKKEEEETEK